MCDRNETATHISVYRLDDKTGERAFSMLASQKKMYLLCKYVSHAVTQTDIGVKVTFLTWSDAWKVSRVKSESYQPSVDLCVALNLVLRNVFSVSHQVSTVHGRSTGPRHVAAATRNYFCITSAFTFQSKPQFPSIVVRFRAPPQSTDRPV